MIFTGNKEPQPNLELGTLNPEPPEVLANSKSC